MNPRSWLFLGLSLTVAAACTRLGIWQLERLEERRARNAAIEAGLAKDPLSLSAQLDQTDVQGYRRAVASGSYDPEYEIVLTARALRGQPGVHLVTPLLLAKGGPAILVDRGWIPAEARTLPGRARYRVPGQVTVKGVTKLPVALSSFFFLRARTTPSPAQPQLEWQAVDLDAIQAQTPYPLLGVYLAQTEALAEREPAPVPEPELDLSEGPHLGYAIQWFSFAAIALIGGGYWILRRPRHPS